MGEMEPSHTAGGNVQLHSHCGKVWWFLRMPNIHLPYDQAILLLHTDLRELAAEMIQTNTYKSMFIAASFTIAKRKKQPKYPS